MPRWAGAERERQGRQYVTALQTRGSDAVAEQKCSKGDAPFGGRRQFGHHNLVLIYDTLAAEWAAECRL